MQERQDDRLDVVRHLRHGPPGGGTAVRAAVGPVVEGEDAVALGGDAIESGKPDGAVQPRSPVKRDQRPPLPALVDVQLDVAHGDAHRENVASRTPETMSRRMSTATTSR